MPEKMIQTLMKERRDKVEEIKKKTNYYSTRELIQRYDDGSPATPLRPRINPGQALPVTPQQPPLPNSINANGKAVNPALQAQLSRASNLLPFVSGYSLLFYSQLSRPFPYNLNDGNGTIDSLTPFWVMMTRISPLQVLAMP